MKSWYRILSIILLVLGTLAAAGTLVSSAVASARAADCEMGMLNEDNRSPAAHSSHVIQTAASEHSDCESPCSSEQDRKQCNDPAMPCFGAPAAGVLASAEFRLGIPPSEWIPYRLTTEKPESYNPNLDLRPPIVA